MKNKHSNRLEKVMMRIVKSEIKPHWTSHWGQKCYIYPAYAGIAEGDGRQVVLLQTLAHRPNYYILRVDSLTDLESDDFNPEVLFQKIDEVFGDVMDYKEVIINGKIMYKEYFEYVYYPESKIGFPTLDTGCGYFLRTVKTV